MNLQISFRDMDPSPALEEAARRQAEKLSKKYPVIIGCRVMIETPHRSKKSGVHHHVRVDVTIPGEELVATRDPAAGDGHEDAYVAVDDAFRVVRRELDDHFGRTRAKRHD